MNEWQFVSRFVEAPPDQLARLVAGATLEEQEALSAYLGTRRLQQIRQLAVRAAGRGKTRGRVVFVPGIFGSTLVVTREAEWRSVWLDHEAIRLGWFRWLRLASDGRMPFDPGVDVRPAGVLNAVYSELLLQLSSRWDVRAFAYDWRKDMSVAAAELEAFLLAEFGDESVNIVAHSTGATVVRAMLAQRTGVAAKIESVIALGEPVGGSFVVPRILAGIDSMVRRLGRWTAEGSPGQTVPAASDEAAKALASFPALYQMLPWPAHGHSDAGTDPDRMDRTIPALYRPETYAPCPVVVPPAHLDAAREFHEHLDAAGEGQVKIVRVEGYGQPTPVGLADAKRVCEEDAYEIRWRGDGVVPCRAGATDAAGVPRCYFVEAAHGGLASDVSVLAALEELLADGKTTRLGTKCLVSEETPAICPRRGRGPQDDAFDRLVRRLVARDAMTTRVSLTSPAGARLRAISDRVSPDERALEAMLAGDFHATQTLGISPDEAPSEETSETPVPRIAVSLVHSGIEAVHRLGGEGEDHKLLLAGLSGLRFLDALRDHPIDAVSVGHYLGVLPQGPELALDRSISRAVRESEVDRIREAGLVPEDLTPEEGTILTQFSERGILRGELGQPFFLDDPRDGSGPLRRLLVIAGMGLSGRFGAPELTVLARELCWSLGRLGRRHAATVLIGSGAGNLPVPDAVHAWMRGIAQALSGVSGRHPQLERITFVEDHAGRVAELDRAIAAEVGRIASELSIEYTPKTPEELEAIQQHARKVEEHRRRHHRAAGRGGRATTRVSVQIEGETYRFGAITSTASIPERHIPLRRWLVDAANTELAAETDPAIQLDRGQFLGHLLIPEDLRPQFFTRDPLVLMLDSTTARIHWEMMAQSDSDFAPGERFSGATASITASRFPEEYFLGTARGLTRQLRTTFSPPPEPPPPPRRVLRVLVVADPAADAPLPGALEEGGEVASLFEAADRVEGLGENRVEVTRLLGPGMATATNVLRELMSRSYDVFHFAGHCFFDPDTPSASGWVFTDGQILGAELLTRIDRVPKFVFSNACESGVTPDRPEGFSVAMAPSFAEAFFQRGVSNFVCTAWPVDDLAARQFAHRLYEGLLGIRIAKSRASSSALEARAEPMHRAMLEARLVIARNADGTINAEGIRTWGAYQHYGDPYFRFFHGAAVE